MQPSLNPTQARAVETLKQLGGIAQTRHLYLGHEIPRATLRYLERRQLTRSIEHRQRNGSVVHMTRLTDAGREVTA